MGESENDSPISLRFSYSKLVFALLHLYNVGLVQCTLNFALALLVCNSFLERRRSRKTTKIRIFMEAFFLARGSFNNYVDKTK